MPEKAHCCCPIVPAVSGERGGAAPPWPVPRVCRAEKSVGQESSLPSSSSPQLSPSCSPTPSSSMTLSSSSSSPHASHASHASHTQTHTVHDINTDAHVQPSSTLLLTIERLHALALTNAKLLRRCEARLAVATSCALPKEFTFAAFPAPAADPQVRRLPRRSASWPATPRTGATCTEQPPSVCVGTDSL